MVAFSTVLIEHKIFNPKKRTTKVTMLKLWLVYCVSGIQIYLLSTEQIFQFGLRVEDDKSSSTFHKSNDAVLLATPNFQDNIQIVRTCTLKHNVFNPVSLITKYLDFEILYYCFVYIFDKVMYYILNNVEDMKKIYFPTQKYVCYRCTFVKMYYCSFSKNPGYSSKPLSWIFLSSPSCFVQSIGK